MIPGLLIPAKAGYIYWVYRLISLAFGTAASISVNCFSMLYDIRFASESDWLLREWLTTDVRNPKAAIRTMYARGSVIFLMVFICDNARFERFESNLRATIFKLLYASQLCIKYPLHQL